MWFFVSAALAVGLGVLVVWKRRQERAVNDFSEQIRRLTFEAGTAGRIGLADNPKSLEQLGVAVNKLLENLEQRGANLSGREQLFQRLVETVHDAVLVHRNQILFANSRFLTLLGMNAADVIGRPLSDFVGPEYVELVDHNLRRRLSGEPAALGVPVITGPYQSNAQEIADWLLGEGAALQVADAAGLAAALEDLLTHPELRRRIGAKGLHVVAVNRGSLDRLLEIIEPLLA